MTGTRVLVVEDESLLAETLCDLMQDAGCEPVGPAATVAEALRLIEPMDQPGLRQLVVTLESQVEESRGER